MPSSRILLDPWPAGPAGEAGRLAQGGKRSGFFALIERTELLHRPDQPAGVEARCSAWSSHRNWFTGRTSRPGSSRVGPQARFATPGRRAWGVMGSLLESVGTAQMAAVYALRLEWLHVT